MPPSAGNAAAEAAAVALLIPPGRFDMIIYDPRTRCTVLAELSRDPKPGAFSVPAYKHFDVTEIDGVTVVRMRNRRITEDIDIHEFGNEMYSLVENDKPKKLLLSFSVVEFLSSAALGKLISLHRKVQTQGGVLKLSNIRPEIYEVFAIATLDRLFDIKGSEAEALAAF
jgi:anti-sigma B factor antagonist